MSLWALQPVDHEPAKTICRVFSNIFREWRLLTYRCLSWYWCTNYDIIGC